MAMSVFVNCFFLAADNRAHQLLKQLSWPLLGSLMQQCLRNKSRKFAYGASAYLKVGDAPRAFVVLGFADATSLKWFTADRNMIITRNGRVIKTLGFGNDFSSSVIRRMRTRCLTVRC